MRMWDLLRDAGYAGSYDAVRPYDQQWRRAQGQGETAYVPLTFEPGEAYQFGLVARDRGARRRDHNGQGRAHAVVPQPDAVRPCVSARDPRDGVRRPHPMRSCSFALACGRGIYDNMKTAVDTVFVGKVRQFNRTLRAVVQSLPD